MTRIDNPEHQLTSDIQGTEQAESHLWHTNDFGVSAADLIAATGFLK